MASHNQPEPEPLPLPGDVVQVIDKADRWFRMLLVVEEARAWGLKTHALLLTDDGVVPAYYRIQHGKYLHVGNLRMVEADIAKARDQAIETAKLLAKEKEADDERSTG